MTIRKEKNHTNHNNSEHRDAGINKTSHRSQKMPLEAQITNFHDIKCFSLDEKY